jgi:hypothetical protein
VSANKPTRFIPEDDLSLMTASACTLRTSGSLGLR